MTAEQIHEKAIELKLSPETEAEMQLTWLFERERYAQTGEHTHACPECAASTGRAGTSSTRPTELIKGGT